MILLEREEEGRRERERERQTERQRQRDRERERERQTERKRNRDGERERERKSHAHATRSNKSCMPSLASIAKQKSSCCRGGERDSKPNIPISCVDRSALLSMLSKLSQW